MARQRKRQERILRTALLVQQPGSLRLDVHDVLLSTKRSIRPGGASVGTIPSTTSPSSFRWELGDGTVVTEHSMTVALPDGARFAATLGSPVFWDPADPSQGPEGAWLNSSWLKSHWFVHSTASTVQWSLTTAGGRTRSGSGLAHFEKNWGATFPSRWVWAQGIDPATGTSFVLAGGDNPIVPLMPGGAWMLGVRSALGAWNYATARGGQELGVWHDGCRGTITLRADSPEGLVEMSVAALGESFSSIKAPRAGGFLPLSEMSFRGDAVLRLTPRRDGEDDVVNTFSLPSSALEFGGSWRCATDEHVTGGLPPPGDDNAEIRPAVARLDNAPFLQRLCLVRSGGRLEEPPELGTDARQIRGPHDSRQHQSGPRRDIFLIVELRQRDGSVASLDGGDGAVGVEVHGVLVPGSGDFPASRPSFTGDPSKIWSRP